MKSRRHKEVLKLPMDSVVVKISVKEETLLAPLIFVRKRAINTLKILVVGTKEGSYGCKTCRDN